MSGGPDREALRQQMLLRALWQDARPGVLGGWCRDGERFARGLAAYRANAGALAERALAAAYPVLQQLIGEDSFAPMARAFWHRHPPERGDVHAWGAELARFIADAESLADEPYLADVARLEWAVHRALHAADDDAPPRGFEAIADADPARVVLRARAGTVLVPSAHPIVSIWHAHQPGMAGRDDRYAVVREAFAAQRAEPAIVWRRGWRVQVAALEPAAAGFTAAVLDGRSLAVSCGALEHDSGFDLSTWLVGALQQGWLAGADVEDRER